jgi:hypothetical protein
LCKDLRLSRAEAKGEAWAYDVEVGLGQLEDVVLSDVGDVVRDSGRVCLVVDQSGDALRLLSYKPVIILDVGNSHHMQPEQLRLSLLGALRYGKPLLVNLRDRELSEAFALVRGRFEQLAAGLFAKVMSRAVRHKEHFKPLVTEAVEAAHPELMHERLVPVFTEKFAFRLLTHETAPPDAELLKNFYTVACT